MSEIKTLDTQTKFQKMEVYENDSDIALYLDGDLQFFSRDEHRYHEALVHPAMTQHGNPKSVLILGGGDGLALREVLKYDVDVVTLVDIDEVVIDLCCENEKIVDLNKDSFASDKLTCNFVDAKKFLTENTEKFDVILVDLPDPVLEELSDLYTVNVFSMIKEALGKDGVGCVQSGEIFRTTNQFWCLVQTMNEAGLFVLPYHTNVPSFGEWGFNLIGNKFVKVPLQYDPKLELRSLTTMSAAAMTVIPPDYGSQPTIVNTEESRSMYKYHHEGNDKYNGFPQELR